MVLQHACPAKALHHGCAAAMGRADSLTETGLTVPRDPVVQIRDGDVGGQEEAEKTSSPAAFGVVRASTRRA